MEAGRLGEDMQQAGRALHDRLAHGIERVQEKVEERVRRGTDQTRGVLSSLNDEFGGFVREAPILALGGAFALGYLIARAARAFR
jgi:hypothetical protein